MNDWYHSCFGQIRGRPACLRSFGQLLRDLHADDRVHRRATRPVDLVGVELRHRELAAQRRDRATRAASRRRRARRPARSACAAPRSGCACPSPGAACPRRACWRRASSARPPRSGRRPRPRPSSDLPIRRSSFVSTAPPSSTAAATRSPWPGGGPWPAAPPGRPSVGRREPAEGVGDVLAPVGVAGHVAGDVDQRPDVLLAVALVGLLRRRLLLVLPLRVDRPSSRRCRSNPKMKSLA